MAKDKVKFKNPEGLKEEILKKYPLKVAKKRAKSLVINEPDEAQVVQSNVRTIPGIITQRGCTYAGCKGVVLGPTRDVINLTHGPIGCGYYSWLTRRNQTHTPSQDPNDKINGENYITYCFSTDMQDENIVFGGEKKLMEAIREAYEIFKPKAISIFSTCPIGLIGDDVHQVAKDAREELGINVFGFSCEGYRGVSQSAGHHIANNGLLTHVVGRNDNGPEGEFKINLLGEYNIGGDAFVLEKMLEELGITLISTFSGNSTITEFEQAHTADLNLVMCHRSINYIAEMMETKYGIPWFKVNFIGAESTVKGLRKIGEYFENKALSERIEKYIKEKLKMVDEVVKEVKKVTSGKLAMLFVGGSRAHHYQDLFAELEMPTIAAGYEFAHRDDYEGREVIPDIKVDADSRNIEELTVSPDPEKFKPRKTEDAIEALKGKGFTFSDYEGMMKQMDTNALVVDDITHWETEKLVEFFKPAVFCAGIKEKYAVQKMGVPLKQLHSYDYGGPYAGFEGAVNFYQEMERIVGTKIWDLIKSPWEGEPEIVATVGVEA